MGCSWSEDDTAEYCAGIKLAVGCRGQFQGQHLMDDGMWLTASGGGERLGPDPIPHCRGDGIEAERGERERPLERGLQSRTDVCGRRSGNYTDDHEPSRAGEPVAERRLGRHLASRPDWSRQPR
jgi:hypothetical protein